MAISLRGPAATVLTNLPPGKHQDYGALTAALDSRFGLAHQTELNRIRLKARTRHREETLAELAEDVERLVHLAAEAMVEVLAQDQFIDALPEEDMRLRIRQNKPASLRDALRIALELESYQTASKQKVRLVWEAQLEVDYPVQRQATTPVAGEDVLQQLLEAVQSLVRSQRRSGSGGSLICWECNARGHRRRECPRLRKNQQANEAASGKRQLAELAGQSSAGPSTALSKFDIFKTGSIHGGSDSLIVSGTIQGRPCEITVDTGSNISIVRPDVLQGVSQDLICPVNSCLRTVTGERAPIHGKGQLQLRIGSRVIPQELWVADIYDECILGLDFLQVNGCQVNLRD